MNKKLFLRNPKKGVDKEGCLWYNIKCEPIRSAKVSRCYLAGVAEQADARDLKSRDTKVSYRFDPGHRHHRGIKLDIAE